MSEESPQFPRIVVSALGKAYVRHGSMWYWFGRGLSNSTPSARVGKNGVAALHDVSFEVQAGTAFGVIGRNGAGKSTLLQILAGTLQPTTGSCSVRGRVTALLELGSGFNPEFSGRENIYLAGAILGIEREAMTEKFDEIARFADIGDFIEEPVKTYSTGMMMRVAFAVAISVEPDVLIIDEALGVGDIVFQQKCSQRLRELAARGVTLLVVTHDLAFVLNMCQRALWIDQGKVRFLGEAGACVRAYVAAMAALSGNTEAVSASLRDHAAPPLPAAMPLNLTNRERLGDGGVRVAQAWLLQTDGTAGAAYRSGDWAVLTLLIKAQLDVRAVSGGCELRNRHGQVVFATGLRVTQLLIAELAAGETCLVTIRFRLELQAGQYTLDVGCGAGSNADNTWDRVLNAAVLEVSNPPEQEIIHGLVRLPYEITVGRGPKS